MFLAKREPKNKEYSQTAKIEKTKKSNNKSEKGTDPMETFQDAKTQTEVEKAVIKKVAENIPSIPNEDVIITFRNNNVLYEIRKVTPI